MIDSSEATETNYSAAVLADAGLVSVKFWGLGS